MSRIPREWTIKFHERHGRYVTLTEGGTCARRNGDTYDHGVVFSNRKLSIGEIFQLRIDELESKWAGSLVSIGNEENSLFDFCCSFLVCDWL